MSDSIKHHPCFDKDAHKKYARMHIPVAPACNIQCNYCNRKYDCSNESRPGVTSQVLSPIEAVNKISDVLEKIPELRVIGIAGPGDPLANEATFEAIKLIRERYPNLIPCISTNGLRLAEYAEKLHSLGVEFVTITINAVDPEIASKIYSMVSYDGTIYEGIEAGKLLLSKQTEGLEKCVGLSMTVKINIVMIPGINDSHIVDVVKHVKSKGAYSVNILPLIPVDGTPFSCIEAPTPEMRKRLMDSCEGMGINVMRHCKQCRADAIGKLDEDRSSEFSCGSCMSTKTSSVSEDRIAVASDNGIDINRGFGNTPYFYIYNKKTKNLIEKIERPVDVPVFDGHRNHITGAIASLNGAGIVAVSEIGPGPRKILEDMGARILISKCKIQELLDSL